MRAGDMDGQTGGQSDTHTRTDWIRAADADTDIAAYLPYIHLMKFAIARPNSLATISCVLTTVHKLIYTLMYWISYILFGSHFHVSFLRTQTEAIRQHGSRLSDYERQEIDKYPEIWFLGLDACKINAKPGTALNSGYDDDNGSYNKVNQFCCHCPVHFTDSKPSIMGPCARAHMRTFNAPFMFIHVSQ